MVAVCKSWCWYQMPLGEGGHGQDGSNGQGLVWDRIRAQSVAKSGLKLWPGGGLASGGVMRSSMGVGQCRQVRRRLGALAHSVLHSAGLLTSPILSRILLAFALLHSVFQGQILFVSPGVS